MAKEVICKHCGSNKHYSTFCMFQKRKPISQKGRKTLLYEGWRDTIAKPYLDKKYGRVCAACGGARCGNQQLDVDHKLSRGGHAEFKMDLKNVQYLGRYPCHVEKTGTIKWSKKDG